ncbi:unnamed protein product [Cyclocybe aegerita]|uniref:Ubiquitin-like protease family profile domain-containing protein n=1 Tax=Cyclocybe aegerita TaxID=1973307 RepID=A0A8S0VXH1_CYCAE|nr:unnamed protein product [Cyclocybe aegerita]
MAGFKVTVELAASINPVPALPASTPSNVMALPTAPDNPAWRNHGHTFDSLPANVKAYVCRQLEIPKEYERTLFPNPQLSIIDFVYTFTPPPACPDQKQNMYQLPTGHSFFQTGLPDLGDVLALIRVMVPPKRIIAELLKEAKQKWLDGHSSLSVLGEALLIPLWVLSFWTHILFDILPVHRDWQISLEWLRHDEFKLFQGQVQDAIHALSALPWSGYLSPMSSSTSSMSLLKSTLSLFLSCKWLSNKNTDQMTHLLQKGVEGSKSHSNIIFLSNQMGRTIINLYLNEKSGKSKYNPDGGEHFQRFGARLSGSSRIAGIIHVNGNHWVAVIVDVGEEKFWYGDPARRSPDVNVRAALLWFLLKHVILVETADFKDVTLPTPMQDFSLDWFNCGIFSYNALSHHFLHEPLLRNTHNPIYGDLGRIGVFCKLVDDYKLNCPPEEAALAITFDAKSYFGLKEYQRDLDHSPSPPITPRPATPPPHEDALVLSKALKQMSVSPKKPKAKKKKTATADPKSARSVVAPIFQIPTGRTSSKVSKKRRREESDNEENLKARPPKHTGSEDSDTSDSPIARNPGCPRIGLLDKFTVALNTWRGEVQAHRCIGKGCPKVHKPQSCIRVLNHAKRCLKLTSDQHKMASAASSKDAPSAVVENSLKTLPFGSSTSQSCAPNQEAPQPASYQGEPQGSVIVVCSSTPLTPSTPPITDKLAFFGPRGHRVHHQALNAAVLKFICAARVAPAVVDLDEWKAMFLLQTPSYSPASRTTLMENHIMSEQDLLFDGGSIRSGNLLYTVHATTEEHRVMLIEGQECTNISHTGRWIADLVLSVMDLVGRNHFIAVSSDNTGNTQVVRDILSNEVPLLLNLPDPAHHLNNTWKDIANLPYFKELIKQIRTIIKYFKHANFAKALLKELREKMNLGPGLESIGKTRFSTLLWSAESLKHSLIAILELVQAQRIEIPKANHIFLNENARLRFEILLVQFIEVGSGIARAIECLEAESATPADVYLYWLAILASMKQALEGSFLPDDVKGEIRGIMNARWREFFVEGPTNAHLVAFYLNPSYARSSIFKRPNPLAFNIILPGRGMPQVPPGINNPRTFLQVGDYLFHLLTIEIQKGTDPFLTAWKGKARQFDVAFRAQFTAYAQGAHPFTTPLGFGENPYNWWQAFIGTSNGGILAAIAVKLYAAVPHSMADERTMSSITLLNTAQRNRQQVPTVIAMAQINGYYKGEKPRKLRKPSRPNPLLKFFDINRLLRSIENDDDDGKAAPDYDESEDEEDVVLRGKDEDPNAPLRPPPSSDSLLFDSSDDEIEMESEELEEILADAPAFRRIKKDRFAPVVEEVVEDGGEFKLGPWVQGVGKYSRATG